MRFFVHRVLESDLAKWLALGWREVARDYKPSIPCADVLIRFDGPEAPKP